MVRTAVVAFVIAGVLIAAILFVPAPRFIVSRVALASSQWLLTDYIDGENAGRGGSLRKFIVAYLQTAVGAEISDAVDRTAPRDDVERVAASAHAVQQLVLNHLQVPHPARPWPVSIVGFGFCDQINGVVARVLSHRFAHAQVWALFDARRGISPHSIGRVWSAERGNWLYFDAFWDRCVVYERDRAGRVHILRQIDSGQPSRATPLYAEYSLPGNVLNEYAPTYGGYLLLKVRQAVSRQTVASLRGVDPEVSGLPAHPSGAVRPPRDPVVFRATAKMYMDARLQHIYGAPGAAAAYRRVASDRRAAADEDALRLAQAASEFAAQLTRPHALTAAR